MSDSEITTSVPVPTVSVCDTLSPEQAAELAALKADAKYGVLVSDAFSKWCSGEATPATGSVNLDCNINDENGYAIQRLDHFVKMYPERGCCLLGAAMLGKPAKAGEGEDDAGTDPYIVAQSIYGLTYQEVCALYGGFDRPDGCHKDGIGARAHHLVAQIWGSLAERF